MLAVGGIVPGFDDPQMPSHSTKKMDEKAAEAFKKQRMPRCKQTQLQFQKTPPVHHVTHI